MLCESQSLILQAVLFNEVQSTFARYEIEVGTWGDVPHAVQKLAHKQGKEPLPDGESCSFVQTSMC